MSFEKHIRVWRSLVSRLNGVQEAASSNLVTRTIKNRLKSCDFNRFSLYFPVQIIPQNRRFWASPGMQPEWEIFYSFLPIISSCLSNFSPYFLVFSNIFENLYGCIILCFGFYAQCAKLSKFIYLQNRAKIFVTCPMFSFALIVQSDYLCNSPATLPDSSLGAVHWQWLCEWSNHKTTENDIPCITSSAHL